MRNDIRHQRIHIIFLAENTVMAIKLIATRASLHHNAICAKLANRHSATSNGRTECNSAIAVRFGILTVTFWCTGVLPEATHVADLAAVSFAVSNFGNGVAVHLHLVLCQWGREIVGGVDEVNKEHRGIPSRVRTIRLRGEVERPAVVLASAEGVVEVDIEVFSKSEQGDNRVDIAQWLDRCFKLAERKRILVGCQLFAAAAVVVDYGSYQAAAGTFSIPIVFEHWNKTLDSIINSECFRDQIRMVVSADGKDRGDCSGGFVVRVLIRWFERVKTVAIKEFQHASHAPHLYFRMSVSSSHQAFI
jgi:hypothetical protein